MSHIDKYRVPRCETRLARRIPVLIAGHAETPGAEKTMTQDVSARGARVITRRPWESNQVLVIASFPVRHMSLARVTYCQPLPEGKYAVGLKFLEPAGKKVVGFPDD